MQQISALQNTDKKTYVSGKVFIDDIVSSIIDIFIFMLLKLFNLIHSSSFLNHHSHSFHLTNTVSRLKYNAVILIQQW